VCGLQVRDSDGQRDNARLEFIRMLAPIAFVRVASGR
jgi:hypothetical protein